MNTVELYHQFRPMIRSFSRKYSGLIDPDEIEAQGNLIFIETIIRYDEHQARFSTYLYHRLDRKLQKFAMRQQRNEWPVIASDISYDDRFIDRILFQDICDRLTMESRDIANDILSGKRHYRNSRSFRNSIIAEFRQMLELQ
jgi:hypothetical protein